MILVKISTVFFDKSPVFCIAGTQIFMFDQFDKFCIKNPIDKVIFVLEMIVKALSVHVAALADLRHIMPAYAATAP